MNTLFETLAVTSGRNDKIKMLKENDSPLLRKIIRLALDPFTQFYIRKIPEYTSRSNPPVSLEKALDNLSALSSRRLTGNVAIIFLTELLGSLPDDDAKVIERVIQKDLKCGIAAATVNAAFGKDFIVDYPVMLCSPSDSKVLANMSFPAAAQVKMDGMRFNAIVENGKVQFRSRNGKYIDLHDNLENEFLKLAQNIDTSQFDKEVTGLVFDGELLVYRDGEPVSRQEGNGILNKAVRGTITPEEASLVQAVLWDVMPVWNLRGDGYGFSYNYRLELLHKADRPRKIHLVEGREVDSLAEAQEFFQECLSRGLEGIILKDLFEPWENKRVKHQVKFKAEETADLLCVGWTEGSGKYEGMLGSLNLKSGDDFILVDVGTGFTDEQRRTLTPENTIGKIVEVKYNAIISDKRTGQHSLFLPVFLNIREDKNIPDLFQSK